MSVQSVLKAYPREVLTASPEEGVRDLARKFGERKSALAVVCGTDERVLGVVTLGDIVYAIGENGADAIDRPVGEVMTKNVATCGPNDDIEDALTTMAERGIRHLPVVENGRLIGFIDKPAALEVLFDQASLDFAQLRGYVFKDASRF